MFLNSNRPSTSGIVRIAVIFFMRMMLPTLLVGIFERLFKFLHPSYYLCIGLLVVFVFTGVSHRLSGSTILLVPETLCSIVHAVHTPCFLHRSQFLLMRTKSVCACLGFLGIHAPCGHGSYHALWLPSSIVRMCNFNAVQHKHERLNPIRVVLLKPVELVLPLNWASV